MLRLLNKKVGTWSQILQMLQYRDTCGKLKDRTVFITQIYEITSFSDFC